TEPGAPQRIVLIEDNDDAREALAIALRLAGHEVFVGSSAEAALELARGETPDTFILDVGLPGMDGYELAKALRALPECRGAKIIAVTGYGKDTDKERARDVGFDHHLTKLIDVDRLQELLRN